MCIPVYGEDIYIYIYHMSQCRAIHTVVKICIYLYHMLQHKVVHCGEDDQQTRCHSTRISDEVYLQCVSFLGYDAV